MVHTFRLHLGSGLLFCKSLLPFLHLPRSQGQCILEMKAGILKVSLTKQQVWCFRTWA